VNAGFVLRMKAANRDDIEVEEYQVDAAKSKKGRVRIILEGTIITLGRSLGFKLFQVQLMLLDNIDKKKTPNQSRSWCCLTSLVPSQEHLKPFSHPASWKHAYK